MARLFNTAYSTELKAAEQAVKEFNEPAVIANALVSIARSLEDISAAIVSGGENKPIAESLGDIAITLNDWQDQTWGGDS